MDKTHNKARHRRSSLLFSCFGSFSRKSYIENVPDSDHHSPKQKSHRWLSWGMITMKNSDIITVPLESSAFEKKPISKPKSTAKKSVHSSKPKSKSNPRNPPAKIEAPATNLSSPSQTPPVVHVTPNQTPPQTGDGHTPDQNREEDTRQQSRASTTRATPAMSETASLATTKRQARRFSSKSMQPQTISGQTKRQENAKRLDPVVGMSTVMVTMIIMMLWGRLCAILCTSVWLYLIPRFRSTVANDGLNLNANSNDLDLDSKVYKKKVILEGLLERNHRGTS